MKPLKPKEGYGPVKRRGWLACQLGVDFFLFGLAFGVAEYFIAASLCVLLMLIALVQAALQRPQFKLETGSGRVVRGQPKQVLLRAYNPRSWPFFPLRFFLALQKDNQEPWDLANFEIALKPGEEKILEIETICPHRGEYIIFMHRYYGEDLFGLLALPGLTPPAQKLLSLPQLTFSPGAEQKSAVREEEEIRQGRREHHGHLTAESRTYQQGDALRAIHWKKSASRRELMSRLREHTADYSCCLLVDNRPLKEGEEALVYEDRLCEAALSFLFKQLSFGQPITLLPGRLSLQTPENVDKAAELLATLPFAIDAVFGELKSLLEIGRLPTELYLAAAQPLTPLQPLLEQIADRGCSVSILAPTADAALVESGLELPLPVISIDPPYVTLPWLEA